MTPSVPFNIFDPNWVAQQTKLVSQQQADNKNAANTADYLLKVHNTLDQNTQLQANNQPLITLAPPPYKLVLDSNGAIVNSPDFVTPALSVVPAKGVASSTTVKQTDPSLIPPDRLDQIMGALQLIYSRVDTLAKKEGV